VGDALPGLVRTGVVSSLVGAPAAHAGSTSACPGPGLDASGPATAPKHGIPGAAPAARFTRAIAKARRHGGVGPGRHVVSTRTTDIDPGSRCDLSACGSTVTTGPNRTPPEVQRGRPGDRRPSHLGGAPALGELDDGCLPRRDPATHRSSVAFGQGIQSRYGPMPVAWRTPNSSRPSSQGFVDERLLRPSSVPRHRSRDPRTPWLPSQRSLSRSRLLRHSAGSPGWQFRPLPPRSRPIRSLAPPLPRPVSRSRPPHGWRLARQRPTRGRSYARSRSVVAVTHCPICIIAIAPRHDTPHGPQRRRCGVNGYPGTGSARRTHIFLGSRQSGSTAQPRPIRRNQRFN
jgi:hypothetical protein